MNLVLKTRKGLEKIVASQVREILPEAEVTPEPFGYLGVVFVNVADKWKAAELISERIPEVDRVLVVERVVSAKLNEIEEAALDVAKRFITAEDRFAVRTTRRGRHDFTSIDVNVRVGAAIRGVTNAEVDLEEPTKPLYIEIFQDVAAVCIPVTREYRKLTREKPMPLQLLRKIAVGQFVYDGDDDVVKKMGERIGRAAQTFEIGELSILLYKPVSAKSLRYFLESVEAGVESRYQIQLRSYGRAVWRVPVYVYELYHYVRDRSGEPIIATDPKGVYISHAREKLAQLFSHDRINVLIGSREGIPPGVFRFTSLVIDLMPGVTLATDFVIPSVVVGFVSTLEEAGVLPRRERTKHK